MLHKQPSDASAPGAKHPQDSADSSPGASSDSAGERLAPPERRGSSFMNFFASILASKNPISHPADPKTNDVWLFDNTAFQPEPEPGAVEQESNPPTSWNAEFVTCIFEKEGRKDAGKFVAAIADYIGLDGENGAADAETRKRIEDRVQPFLDHVSPGRNVTLELDIGGSKQSQQLGPSDRNGIISQIVQLDAPHVQDGTIVRPRLQLFGDNKCSVETHFAAPPGWLVISDIDDTIKRTMTMEATGILRTTFTEEPVPISGMPEFYRHVHSELNPTWFYLSASPYNLYPFLHQFLHDHYVTGTLILRDYSWMDINGLIKSFTEETQEYKTERMEKIHRWFPQRKVLCIGDSTQKDPEAYADIYRKYPSWIHAIAIRKVTNVGGMEDKNKNERFEEAFEEIPSQVWTVFEDPVELYDFVDQLGMEDQVL